MPHDNPQYYSPYTNYCVHYNNNNNNIYNVQQQIIIQQYIILYDIYTYILYTGYQ